jgi:hypothetical protein
LVTRNKEPRRGGFSPPLPTARKTRDDYQEKIEALRQWPGYLKDEDDTYDNTYALFYFEVPKEYAVMLSEASPNIEWEELPAAQWRKALDNLK